MTPPPWPRIGWGPKEFRARLAGDDSLFNYCLSSEPDLYILHTYRLPSAAWIPGLFNSQTHPQAARRKNGFCSDSRSKWRAVRSCEIGVHSEIELPPEPFGNSFDFGRVGRPD